MTIAKGRCFTVLKKTDFKTVAEILFCILKKDFCLKTSKLLGLFEDFSENFQGKKF